MRDGEAPVLLPRAALRNDRQSRSFSLAPIRRRGNGRGGAVAPFEPLEIRTAHGYAVPPERRWNNRIERCGMNTSYIFRERDDETRVEIPEETSEANLSSDRQIPRDWLNVERACGATCAHYRSFTSLPCPPAITSPTNDGPHARKLRMRAGVSRVFRRARQMSLEMRNVKGTSLSTNDYLSIDDISFIDWCIGPCTKIIVVNITPRDQSCVISNFWKMKKLGM